MLDHRSFTVVGTALFVLAACVDQPIAPDAQVERNQAVGLEAASASLIPAGSDIEVSFACFGAESTGSFGSFGDAFITLSFGPGASEMGFCSPRSPHTNSFPRVGTIVLRNVPGGEALLNVQLNDIPLDFQASCTLRFVELPQEPFRCTFESSDFAEQIAEVYSNNQALLKAGVIVSFRRL